MNMKIVILIFGEVLHFRSCLLSLILGGSELEEQFLLISSYAREKSKRLPPPSIKGLSEENI